MIFPASARVSQAVVSLQGSNGLNGAQVSAGLPQLLSGLATSLVVAKSLLVISALQLALLAAVALGLATRLLASHREEESALLTGRGATRWQLARTTPAETVLLGGVAAVAGCWPMASLPPQMEILYRDRLSRSSRLVTGHFPQQGQVSHGQVILQIAVTPATAARFGLRPGSRLGYPPNLTLEVTGIVTPVDPGSAFWGVDRSPPPRR